MSRDDVLDDQHATGPGNLPLGEVFDFLRLMWALDHALQKASKRIEASLGVTGPQRMVIRIVGRFPGIAAGKLAEILHLHPSTLTGVVRRLQQQGVLARWADPRDQRRALLGLTQKGRALDVDTPGTIEASVRELLTEVPAARIRTTAAVLSRLAMLFAERAPARERHRSNRPARRKRGRSRPDSTARRRTRPDRR
jgi:DNA-binding MarR family transcriptional regulator